MLFSVGLWLLAATLSFTANASPVSQHAQIPFLESDDNLPEVTAPGHFSEWARESKYAFLRALRKNKASDWWIVLGNEGGDTDSMASALAFAYYLNHLPEPVKAVALLQTEEDALELRPENKLALKRAKMSSGHRDLLTIDELPIKPFDMYHRIKGLALVDHNVPRGIWRNATILSIIDHHDDRGLAKKAFPRVVEKSASCASHVAKILLDDYDSRSPETETKTHGPLPRELIDLLMRTIAIDSGGLSRSESENIDRESARRLFELSSWRDGSFKMKEVMKELNRELTKSKKSLDDLSLRDLLRRDWKGDAVPTKSKAYPSISIGLASIPVSMEEQILRLPEQTTPEWFAVERAFTSEVGVDVSVVLTTFRDRYYIKHHEIALVVAHGWSKRLTVEAADSLFHQIKSSIEGAKELEAVEEWRRPDGKELLPRRAVWKHRNDEAGRKLIRPIVERAIKTWRG